MSTLTPYVRSFVGQRQTTAQSHSEVTVPVAPTVKLNNGVEIPRLGLGTWPLTGGEAERVVATAIDVGYRLIDTASRYGNEEAVG